MSTSLPEEEIVEMEEGIETKGGRLGVIVELVDRISTLFESCDRRLSLSFVEEVFDGRSSR